MHRDYGLHNRIVLLMGGTILLVSLMAVRLIYVIGLEAPSLAEKALSQRTDKLPLELARGQITDRNGRLLTGTAGEVNLVVFPKLLKDKDRSAIDIAGITGMSPVVVKKEIVKHDSPFVLKRRVGSSLEQAVVKADIQGLLTVRQKLRYFDTGLASHLVGYVNGADNRGVSGVEGRYDSFLREADSQTLSAIVDGRQRLIPGLGFKLQNPEPWKGLSELSLTIDLDIQEKLEEVMSDVQKGAAVAMDPKTGEILAMASRPSFDQNNIQAYLDESDSPLMNRAISAFHPGSVFKLVTAAAALEGGIKPDEVFHDPGYAMVGKSLRIRCADYASGGHGDITLLEGLVQSCNTVFVEAGLRLGAQPIFDMARKFGFGSTTGLGLSEESCGSLPDPARCSLGDIANMSLGQKGVLVTPLQVAVMISTIVNDGAMVQPVVAKSLVDSEGRSIRVEKGRLKAQVISPSTARLLRLAMEQVVDRGTGKEAWVAWGGCAGKTGSAETGRRDSEGNGIDHAWFAGYAPRLSPEIVAVFLVEDGGMGGQVAAPLFKRFIEAI